MKPFCELAAPFLANAAVEDGVMPRLVRPHVTRCLRCQARHVFMARTARELRALANEVDPPPLDLEWRVMSSLEGELAISSSWRFPLALVAALFSLSAALLIWKMRPRTS